ncbi:MAG: prepilin-type N-terminal cleavage/methylation domain-containing protein, partial [Planctomycetota bacterium]|nr:prepilin-type N-terminal cleavage/methylation domain-containing protein [Planctomycetota bacterium]
MNNLVSTLTRNRRRAFTLVEILVVVVILGILAAIVSTRFATASEDAAASAAQSDLKHLQT